MLRLLGTTVLGLAIAIGGCDGVLSGGPGAAPGSPAPAPGGDQLPAPAVPPGPAGNQPPDGQNPAPEGPDPTPPASDDIWRPEPGTSWHWQLSGSIDTGLAAEMYDIDLFDNSAATVAALQAQGKVVICYFSAGSFEAWRPDAGRIPAAARGQKMGGWDELWLDVRSTAVRDVMGGRLDLAQQKGCDGVEPDNVDGYANQTGFALTANDQLDFNRFLAAGAHARGLSVGLKNDLDQVAELEPDFDWALNEECMAYSECEALAPFIDAGKAVFHVEYSPNDKAAVCSVAQPLGFDSMVKHMELDAWYQACW